MVAQSPIQNKNVLYIFKRLQVDGVTIIEEMPQELLHDL